MTFILLLPKDNRIQAETATRSGCACSKDKQDQSQQDQQQLDRSAIQAAQLQYKIPIEFHLILSYRKFLWQATFQIMTEAGRRKCLLSNKKSRSFSGRPALRGCSRVS
jgi:hypothetical protein